MPRRHPPDDPSSENLLALDGYVFVYRDAIQLLDDFWEMVDQGLKERGAKP